ncbi:MAG: hypothetical protein ACOVRN_04100 [Flavobacterium sp.]
MEGFQKIVLFSAIIILIIALVFIGISFTRATKQSWPPMTPECPDYWTVDSSGKCVNTKDLGTCSKPANRPHLEVNFNDAPYTGANGVCAKYTWAKNCGVSWDGITYGVNNPCDK